MSELVMVCKSCGMTILPEPIEQSLDIYGIRFYFSRQEDQCSGCSRYYFEEMFKTKGRNLIKINGRGISVDWKIFDCSPTHTIILLAAQVFTKEADLKEYPKPVMNPDGKILSDNGKPVFFSRKKDGEMWFNLNITPKSK